MYTYLITVDMAPAIAPPAGRNNSGNVITQIRFHRVKIDAYAPMRVAQSQSDSRVVTHSQSEPIREQSYDSQPTNQITEL